MRPRARASTSAAAPPAVLFCGLIYGPSVDVRAVLRRMMAAWGPLTYLSARIPFSYTTYYHEEMGEPLFRRFVALEAPVPQESLPALKEEAGTMEDDFLRPGGGRSVNIDPGLLLPDRLVLATTKPGPHRVYLGRGIYADLTLLFQRKSYRPLPWTYPDYADPGTIQRLNRLRTRHRFLERWRGSASG